MIKPIADIDGNPLPPPPAGSALEQLEHILLFGRRNDFQIGPYIKIGDITIQVRDLRQLPRSAGGIPDVDPFDLALGNTGGE